MVAEVDVVTVAGELDRCASGISPASPEKPILMSV
jgi:hypothetical protein